MSVAVKKVNGVESVNVSLNEGKASIRFKPDSTAKYEDVRSGIEKNGFAVKAAQVRARGKLQQAGGALQFVVNGSGEVFNVSLFDPQNVALQRELQAMLGQEVAIDATVPEPEKNKRQDRLLVKSVVGGKDK